MLFHYRNRAGILRHFSLIIIAIVESLYKDLFQHNPKDHMAASGAELLCYASGQKGEILGGKGKGCVGEILVAALGTREISKGSNKEIVC